MAHPPGPEGCQDSGCQVGPRQKRLLCVRLVAVREALTQIRKERALQDAEQQDAEQEAGLR